MDNIKIFEDLKNEIRECKSLSELKGFENTLKNMIAFTKRYIEKIKLENPSENTKKPSPTSINRIALFLNEIIFPNKIEEIKTNVLYKEYKIWNKKDPTRKTYGKQKFYNIIKLGKRVKFQHRSTGDYFIFEYDKKTS